MLYTTHPRTTHAHTLHTTAPVLPLVSRLYLVVTPLNWIRAALEVPVDARFEGERGGLGAVSGHAEVVDDTDVVAVAEDDPLAEGEAAPELVDQLLVRVGRDVVDGVVARHGRPHAGAADGDPGAEKVLVEGAVADVGGAAVEPPRGGAVGCVVLAEGVDGAGGEVVLGGAGAALEGEDGGAAEVGGEDRVLAGLGKGLVLGSGLG